MERKVPRDERKNRELERKLGITSANLDLRAHSRELEHQLQRAFAGEKAADLAAHQKPEQ